MLKLIEPEDVSRWECLKVSVPQKELEKRVLGFVDQLAKEDYSLEEVISKMLAWEKAQIYFLLKEFEKAEVCFWEVLREWEMQKEFSEKENEEKELIPKTSENILTLLYALSECIVKQIQQKQVPQRKYREYEKICRRALELGAEEVLWPYNLGLSLTWQEKNKEAEEFFRKALAIEPNNVNILLQLGRCLNNLRRGKPKIDEKDEVREIFEKAWEIEPENLEVFRELVDCYLGLEVENLKKRAELYRQFLGLRTDLDCILDIFINTLDVLSRGQELFDKNGERVEISEEERAAYKAELDEVLKKRKRS